MIWLVLFLVNALAVHRLTHLVIDDKITEPLRDKIYDRFGQPMDTWTYLFTCPWCVSIWVGGLAVAGLLLVPIIWLPLALLLSFSSFTGLLYKLEDRI
jgi:hypothetical protein